MINKDMIWNNQNYSEFIEYLYTKKDSDKFIEFSKKLIFTNSKMIGIKVPVLRNIAKEISKTDIYSFLNTVKSNTYEEIILEGLVISYIKDYDTFKKYFSKFIKKIDNWSTCDICISSMKIIIKHKDEFFKDIKKYLKSKDEFIVRVGVILLLDFYIEDTYIDEIFALIDDINREEYYINMAIAWLISVCFVKQKEKTINYLKNNNLNAFTHNKAIQKIRESRRVTKEEKNVVANLKKQVI